MNTIAPTRRIAIAVQPRLLEDTLSLALKRLDAQLVRWEGQTEAPEPFDLAVVNREVPLGMNANVVIRLDVQGGGSVTTPTESDPVALGGLSDVVEAVDRLLV